MTVKAMAKRLDVSLSLIYTLVATGKLKCYRIGNGKGLLRFDEGQLADYLRQAETSTPPPPPPRLNLKHLSL